MAASDDIVDPDAGSPPEAAANPLILSRKPGLDDARALLDVISAHPADKELELDAAAVETMSTPLTLLLVSTVRSREATGGKIAIRDASPAFTEAFSDLGFFQDMMKMEFRQ